MKKILCTLIATSLWCNAAYADRVIVLDNNNNVKQEIYTQPQQVIVQQPVQTQEVVVVRPRPVVRSYYYDPVATTLFAGFTGALIGGVLRHHGGHHHGSVHHGVHHGGHHGVHHGGHHR